MGPTVTLFGKLISHHKNINQKKKKNVSDLTRVPEYARTCHNLLEDSCLR